MAQSVTGSTSGLKAQQRDALQRIYRRSVPPDSVITLELAHFMASISREMRRQVGVLIDRRGRIQHVLIGDGHKLVLPDLGRHRAGRSRLRGVRLIHTHVFGETLTRDDLTDLTLLQLDMMAVLQVSEHGQALSLEYAHLVPPGPADQMWELTGPIPIGDVDLPFQAFIEELEEDFARRQPIVQSEEGHIRAIAVHVTTGAHGEPDTESSLAELGELARTAKIDIVETVVQRRRALHPKFVMGRGRLEDLVLASMQQQVELILFDRDLSPAQARSIADVTEVKVIDRRRRE